MKTTITSLDSSVYPKECFDRFGDDLCGHILSYLPIGHKLVFECVCRQWQSVIFNSQKILIITEYSKQVLNKELRLKFRRFQGFDEDFNVIKIQNRFWIQDKQNILRQLFRKFKFITDLRIKCFRISNQLMSEMIDYCSNRVTSVDFFADNDMKAHHLEGFGRKFGETLATININNLKDRDFSLILKWCPNVKTIYLYNSLKVLSKQFVPKLQEINCRKSVDSNDFDSFVDHYRNQLKKLTFVLSYNLSTKLSNVKRLLIVSQFVNLEELYITLSRTEDFSANCMQSITKECKKLKVLTLNVFSLTFNSTFFKNLSAFESLCDLRISLFEYTPAPDANQPIDCFRICSKVKYFSINTISLNDDDLSVILKCFPNLNTFYLNCRTDGLNITDKTLDNLTKLQNLSTLSLKTYKYFPYITDSSMASYLHKSSTIKTISIRYNLESMQTIEELIEKAIKNPTILYKYDFCVKDLDHYLYTRSQLTVPTNLKLFALNGDMRQDFICSFDQIWRLDSDYDKYRYWLHF